MAPGPFTGKVAFIHGEGSAVLKGEERKEVLAFCKEWIEENQELLRLAPRVTECRGFRLYIHEDETMTDPDEPRYIVEYEPWKPGEG